MTHLFCMLLFPPMAARPWRMCALFSLGAEVCLTAVNFGSWKLKLMQLCGKARALVIKRHVVICHWFLINTDFSVLNQEFPSKSTATQWSVYLKLFPFWALFHHFTPHALPSLFTVAQLACVSLPHLWLILWKSTSYFKAGVCLKRSFLVPCPWHVWKERIYMVSRPINRIVWRVSALFSCNLFWLSQQLRNHLKHMFLYIRSEWSDVCSLSGENTEGDVSFSIQ